MEVELINLQESVDFSAVSLFLQAGIVVKLVMILLLLGSIISWAIIIQKSLKYRQINSLTGKFEDNFWHGSLSIEEQFDRIRRSPKGASERIFCAAMEEWDHTQNKTEGVAIRVDRSMSAAVNTEVHHLSRGLNSWQLLAPQRHLLDYLGRYGEL